VLYPGYERNSNLYNIFFNGDLALMHMHNDNGSGKSIFVVRDSYGHAFLPFLANNYEDVYALEPRYFETFDIPGFIAGHAVDELLVVGYSLPAASDYWLNWPNEISKLY
jgi:hypothetical protein